ncbi:hypothetical protein [Caryophanon tenue]|uniref:Uncharacterized protein n=1 Tax=Caryophanon tenue TaxID=33978 RepID=A0A1C0Y716_9BACL|nr:hypothetical protein [Caryophanon tenue]OCS82979.1 hypothetical protein A6M13_06150 [Caryophanon tenue]
MQQLTTRLEDKRIKLLILYACFSLFIIATTLPITILLLPFIAYTCKRLYIQLQQQSLDLFTVTFELGGILSTTAIFITLHTVLY